MQPDQPANKNDNKTTEVWVTDSDETKKSLEEGKKVIELNKKLTAQDGKDPEAEEKKDEEDWRNAK